ncbi:MAG: DUF5024 domain-containing protein [Tannerellaceae bacterium]|jgi:hypothetical protein|nr:DUF5024 domain-containing protein [Tannerellaceae bacterium]
MKTKKLIMVAIILIAGSFSSELLAQETLKALVQKCENMENVDMSIIRKKNEKREVTRVTISINLNNNPALINEFIAAFEKDREMADREIENRKNGKMNDIYYTFGDVSYSFSQAYDQSATITVIEKRKDD